jgi:hypothetical protein
MTVAEVDAAAAVWGSRAATRDSAIGGPRAHTDADPEAVVLSQLTRPISAARR